MEECEITMMTNILFANGKAIQFTKSLHQGQNAEVFVLKEPNYIAKIFHTPIKFKKIEALMKASLSLSTNIIVPSDVIVDIDGNVKGIILRKIEGQSIKHRLFVPPSYLQSYEPALSQKNLINICLQIIQMVKQLHSKGIIIGDFNPGNFFIDAAHNVYMIDCDNFQIDGHTCQLLYPAYAATELYEGAPFNEQTDMFSLCCLLFSILTLGQHPYQQIGKESSQQHLLHGHFPYHPKHNTHPLAPKGYSVLLWNSLPSKIKTLFYHTFHRDGYYYEPHQRQCATQLEQLFHQYYMQLKKQTVRKHHLF